MDPYAIEINNLTRSYKSISGVIRRKAKEIVALDDISFNIQYGELFGLLGPNGAGKTTTVKVLATLLIPSSGEARVLGHDVVKETEKIRKHIGFVFGGERGLYWRLSGIDNLRYFASLYHVGFKSSKNRIAELLELVGLAGRGNEKVEGYSRGMKQRLHIARCLLHDPEVLFLDEPTIGLDPVGAREIRQLIRNLQTEKKTILLTTHYMFEADDLCQRIAIIDHGKIVALDTPKALKRVVADLSIIDIHVFGITENRLASIRDIPFVDAVSVENVDQRQLLRIHSTKGAEVVPSILNALNELRIGAVAIREPTLEDAYIRIVGDK